MGRSGPSQRQLRVGEELRHALSEVFARGELHDFGRQTIAIIEAIGYQVIYSRTHRS